MYCYLHEGNSFICLHFTDDVNVTMKKNPTVGRQKHNVDVVISIIVMKSVAFVFVFFAVWETLSHSYLCFTCRLHFAHSLNHEMIQFLKMYKYFDFQTIAPPYTQLMVTCNSDRK